MVFADPGDSVPVETLPKRSDLQSGQVDSQSLLLRILAVIPPKISDVLFRVAIAAGKLFPREAGAKADRESRPSIGMK
jgi:hypothetical protein